MVSCLQQVGRVPAAAAVRGASRVGVKAPRLRVRRIASRQSVACPGRLASRSSSALMAYRHRVFSAEATESTAIGSDAWIDFGKAVSGEWEGATSSFGADGTVKELPPLYVPDAYREWDVKVVDWTHMTSSLAESDGLLVSVKRFMPTVGCEADAVAYVDESLKALKSGDGHAGESKTISKDGSYSIGTRLLASDGDGFLKHRIEACIARDDQNRVRVVYTLQRNNADAPWRVMNLDVFNEGYVGEYEGGTDLRSCGGASGYGEKQRTDIKDVCGTWETASAAAYECLGDDLKLHATDSPKNSIDLKDPDGIITLPLGVWSRVNISGSNVCLDSGCVISPTEQRVVSREYVDGKLSSVVIRDIFRADGDA